MGKKRKKIKYILTIDCPITIEEDVKETVVEVIETLNTSLTKVIIKEI